MATFKAIKGNAKSRSAMKNALDYISQKNKTLYHDRALVTGHNCVARCAYDEMITTKHRWHKTDGTQFYHFVQSFSPEEAVSPEEVHAIGLELAEKLFPDFEVLVATHTDTDHLHSHLIVNSVSFVNGRKLHQNAGDLQHQREVSDAICATHGLTVLEPPQKYGHGKGMSSKEYRSAAKGQSWKFQLMNTIDLCMRRAKTKKEFVAEMERRGYQVRWEENRKAITYITPRGMKCRDDRLHDKKYLKGAMDREFRIREQIILRRVEVAESAGRGDAHRGVITGGRANADLPDPGAVDRAGGDPGQPVRDTGQAAQPHPGTGNDPEQYLLGTVYTDEADGEAHAGSVHNPLGGGTGWEQEREEAFEATQNQSPGALSDLAVDHSDSGGVMGNVVRLGHALERGQNAPPVKDATTTQGHSDRKTLSRERQKKIAEGHKPDDHEEQQQQMY